MLRHFAILSLTVGLLLAAHKESNATITADTVVKHSTDGVLDDWDPSAFDIHEATGIRMAADNDADKLYVAMYIVNQDVQKRLMLGGMQLMIDTKAKKKESTYINFPIEKTAQEIAVYLSPKNTATTNDFKVFRDQLSEGMLFLKKTGFKGQQFDTELQTINLPNEININFGWDERSVLFIEYEIPFSKLGDKANLLNKPITVGLKLAAVNLPAASDQPMKVSTKVIAMPMNGGMPSSANFGTSTTGFRTNQPINKSTIPEQMFWLKHQIY